MRKNIALQFIALLAMGIMLLWIAGMVGFFVHVKSYTVSTHKPHTEAIIVLTGGPNRINAGLDLLADDKADYLFISGVNTKVSAEQLIDMWRDDIQAPPCCLVLGHIAKNTHENAAEAYDWIIENDIKSARLLTSNYHMPRALLEFKTVMPEMPLQAHALVPEKTNWILTINEYNKTLFTLLRLSLKG